MVRGLKLTRHCLARNDFNGSASLAGKRHVVRVLKHELRFFACRQSLENAHALLRRGTIADHIAVARASQAQSRACHALKGSAGARRGQ